MKYIALFLYCINLMIHCLTPHWWYESKPPEGNTAARGRMLCVRLTRDDILHPSDGPTIHHNENPHLRLVNHKRPSARATVRKQTEQRRQSASSRHTPRLFAAFPKKNGIFICLFVPLQFGRCTIRPIHPPVFACRLLRLIFFF